MSSLCGYARVSTTDWDLSVQREALKAAGCSIIHEERKTGNVAAGRTKLRTLLDSIRKGESLILTRIDRLTHSIADLQIAM